LADAHGLHPHYSAPVSRPLSQALNYVWIGFVVLVIGTATYMGFQVARAGTQSFWLLLGGPMVAIALLGALRAYRDGELTGWLRPVWGDPTRGVASAALLVLAAIAFVHVVAPVGSPRESWMARIYLQFGDPATLHAHAAVIGVAILVVVAAEEIVWRGLVTTLLAEKIGSRHAWIGAAILYALASVPSAWALRDPVAGLNPMLPLASLAVGLVWGGMGRMTGRLVPSILSHAAFDWCVVMMFRLWGPSI
jgi:membrane protease YdiL (CAAX protease family)